MANAAHAPHTELTLRTRRQVELRPGGGEWRVLEEELRLDPVRLAVLICDMWDKHWCTSATRRVNELAPAMDEAVRSARAMGAFIIHCPSETMEWYEGTPQRHRAMQAPRAEMPVERELPNVPPLPVDASDNGCDCAVHEAVYKAWTRQTPDIFIAPEDAVTDSGEEVWNLLRERGIELVAVMGVHTNMCVLGRPFGIRRLVRLGQPVVLVRDMTDTMYNPRMPPYVSHFRGTELVVEHIERYWCPTIVSTEFTGKPAFRFSEAE